MPQEEYPLRQVVASKCQKNHLRLAFGCEGGGSSGSGVETIERSTSVSRLDAREVVVVADVLKLQKGPPLARVRMRGRVEAVEAALKPLKSPLPARVWTRGRWKRGGGVVVASGVGVSGVVVVSHCRFVLVVRLAASVGMGG